MRILLDHSVPVPVRHSLTRHEVFTAARKGWDRLGNGELISAAADAGFDVLVTCDQNIRYQQNLFNRDISIVKVSTNSWPIISADVSKVTHAVDRAIRGGYELVIYPRPELRRRTFIRPAGPE